jgi:hypothetical protein
LGASRGSISYTLYRVEGDFGARAGVAEWCIEKLNEFAFRELTPDSEDDTTWGWVVMDDLLNNVFDYQNALRGTYICGQLRVDRWALPAALLKARIAKAEEALKAERQRTKLNRSEKEVVRAVVVREMKTQMLPAAAAVDFVFNLDDGTVRSWTQSNARNELFQELFESTFELRMYRTTPWVAARHTGLNHEQLTVLADIEPVRFTSMG